MSNLLFQDDPPDLSEEFMEELRAAATDAKGELRMKKEMLADAYDRMKILIPEWQRSERLSRCVGLTGTD
jgi:hypothetical protein